MPVFKSLLAEIKWGKKPFWIGIFLLLLATGAGQYGPLLLQRMIDQFLTPLAKGKQDHLSSFYHLVYLYLVLIFLTSIFRYYSFKSLIKASNLIVERLRNQVFETMQNLPISYFDHKPAGKIATRIVNDTETLRNQFYDNLLSQLIICLVQVLVIYGILIYLDFVSGLLLLFILPIFYAIQMLYKKLTDQAMKDFYQARSSVNTQVNETMNGVSIIQLYHQEEKVLDAFDQEITKMRQADNQIILADSLASWTLTEFVKYTIISGILAFIGYQFLEGKSSITVGMLFVYLNYLTRLFDLMGMMVRQLPNIQRSHATGKRFLELLNQEREIESSEAIKVSEGNVVFNHVSFAYDQEHYVLNDISIEAKKGETVALVGHTGSGKSSIMNLLYRFYDPQEGEILVDQQAIKDFSRESLRSQMGIVLQDPYLFSGTIASNITMGNQSYSDQEIVDALIQVGAKSLLDKLEKGIYEPVFEKGASFSSGERQLIAFARTLIANPKILILDEATSHIDTETEEIIQQAMEVLKKGRTTFIIAHRLSTIQNADQILVLDQGSILERGNHQSLLEANGIYAQMFRIQEKVS
ncbi:ABC transporter ATP-binding protein [Streptococcus penaeicida]|uniref:ABC transporter ATP-binding protein n=1 Tax=Streptococcus penaeicida TaxID=1765960 RepID=A0A2N8LD73_9STRE|nr:ABC transporter ATP-binding protein [Streptococcus penaeicida]PND48115.1 ABC transporter ATP-binding protein [Streptococcus penaeicida]